MKYDQEVVLGILRGKSWFVEQAKEISEIRLLERVMIAYLLDAYGDYVIKKTGKILDPKIDAFDPVIMSEVLEENPLGN